ncbi:uncharacterized protein LOC130119885 [Lampris incognitus]|uniref:uncharacterized protein LOC130119885 n=1 Tax=Lampris incognitus TaxID=2546036 RepID=UPI0024B5373F|nr:uncharacterized protein LOC130119885 [Lampris incognitus]
MKTRLTCILSLTHVLIACAEVVFIRRAEGQSVALSCSTGQAGGIPTGFHLYHNGFHSQVTLLSMAEGSKLRVNSEHRGRAEVSGRLDSPRVNVTLSGLRNADTGLYTWELTYKVENSSDQMGPCSPQVLLLVDGTGRLDQCSSKYPSLLYAIFTAVGLLLALIWLATIQYARLRLRHKPQPAVPIYEEMSRKQQLTGSSQNNHGDPSHREEADFPLYANPNVRQAQDNHYACPRQVVQSPTGLDQTH